MADDLQGIVQRMLDAGESEESIATVIRAQTPFDVKAQNVTMQANMAAQAGAGAPESQWTPAKIGERALAGAKGEAKGFGVGMAAPVLALGYALRHPVDAANKAGQAALMLGAAGVNAIAHPVDTFNTVAPAVMRAAADPESIGEVAGGIGAAIATPPLVRLAKGTTVGRAIAAGASDAANRIPGVQAAREALAVAKAAKNPSPVVTLADATASRPAATVARREAYAPLAGQPEADAVRSMVVSNADAAASNPGARMADLSREPYRVPQVEGVGRQTPAEATREIMRDQRNLARVEKQAAQKAAEAEASGRSTPQTTREAITASLEDEFGMNPNAPPDVRKISGLEQAGEGATTTNASAGGTGSAEEMARDLSLKAQGIRRVVLGPDGKTVVMENAAVDTNPGPGRKLVEIDANGNISVLKVGTKAGSMTAEEATLVGNRRAGHATQAERLTMLRALQAKQGGL